MMGTGSRTSRRRKRARVESEDGSGSNKSTTSIVSTTVNAVKSAAKKAVSFLSPKKNRSTGNKSDTPLRTSASTSAPRTRSRSSSNASMPSLASSSDQSSFQFNEGSESGSISSKTSPVNTSTESLPEISKEDQDKLDLGVSFVAVSGHWEENGEKVDCLLDFVEVPESHTGETLARVLADVATDYGLEDRITTVTCDNASNNDTMINTLATFLPNFGGKQDHTRCFDHIINLVAKSFLRLFDTVRKAGNGDDDAEEAEELPNLDDLLSEMHDMERTEDEEDDSDDIFDEMAHMLDAERETFLKSTTIIRRAIGKLRTIAIKILNSPTKLRPRWDKIVKSNCLAPRVLPRDVKTRWNSTYDMINFALAYRRALHEITLDDEYGLTDHYISSDEWAILSDLRDILLALKDATLYFSRDSATVATVIPAMDKLDSMFATAIITKHDGEQKTFTPAIQIAPVYAKKTLNRYYAKAYYNRTQRICLILHPRYKIGYMRDNEWDEEDIESAKQDVRDVYQSYRDFWASMVAANVQKSGGDLSDLDETTSNSSSKSSKSSNLNIFDLMELDDDAATAVAAEAIDELDLYLTEPRVKGVTDVLRWWALNTGKYPILSRVALDKLSSPPTSVYVERQFSRGRLLVSSVRNRLSAQTIRELMCLGCWSRQGFVEDNDFKVVAQLPTVEEAEGED